MATRTVDPTGEHEQTVIFLHGRGDNARNFSLAIGCHVCSDEKTLQEKLPGVKWVFPSAPARLSTVYKQRITEWFDIYSLTDPAKEEQLQIQGLRESIEQVHDIIRQESLLVGAHRIILAGISQGCATGLHALLSFEQPLGGFIAANGWAPFRRQIQDIGEAEGSLEQSTALLDFYRQTLGLKLNIAAADFAPRTTPILLMYATDDEVVDPRLSQELLATIDAFGFPVLSKSYDLCGHWLKVPEGVDEIAHFVDESA